jgi:hypothetical protein
VIAFCVRVPHKEHVIQPSSSLDLQCLLLSIFVHFFEETLPLVS